MEISSSKTRERIEKGEFIGWEDIRLPFLGPLRKRGFQPGAFIEYSIQIGLSLVDKVITSTEFFKSLNAFNKSILDPISNRYFFVPNPIKIVIKNSPKQIVTIRLHPNNPKKGIRQLKTTNEFYLSKGDVNSFKDNQYYRLMGCLNFKKEKNRYIFNSKDLESYKSKGNNIIHWLPFSSNLLKVEVLMPNNKVIKGFTESTTNKLKQGEVIQFERFGFCRLDKKLKNKLIFWFAHV